MKTLLDWLDGRKTYIGLIAAGALGIARAEGWVDDHTTEILGVLIATWTGVALRAAWKKGGK